MRPTRDGKLILNQDGFGDLMTLAAAGMTEENATALLVEPLARAGLSTLDWCIGSTGIHNCRIRGRHDMTRALLERSHAENPLLWGAEAPRIFTIGDVVEHFNARERDLLDVVIRAAHARGMQVYGNVRLNHACRPHWLDGVTGPVHADGMRKDFRDEAFQAYLLGVFADLLEKGVDGISLDFERKAPFFPDNAPQDERFAACTRFVRRARALTEAHVIARVAYQPEKGEPQGQQPLAWIREGLLDAVIPATHNHEPDALDWSPARFTEAAAQSPRPCKVYPQIWPTAERWRGDGSNRRHAPSAVRQRIEDLLAMGADGAYFFNFACGEMPEVILEQRTTLDCSRQPSSATERQEEER